MKPTMVLLYQYPLSHWKTCVCVQQLHEQAGYSSSAQLCLNCGNIPLFKRLPNQLIKVFSKQLFGVYPKGSNVI